MSSFSKNLNNASVCNSNENLPRLFLLNCRGIDRILSEQKVKIYLQII